MRKRFDNTLNITIPSEMKRSLNSLARECDVNMADLVRVSIRIMLPVLEAVWKAKKEMMDEMVRRGEGHFRQRHDTLDCDDDYGTKQGGGPC
ncbi:MAG: ribbon-helix-helix protein, CopG family [bacterium]|nr:ribbon-helix-helix protein, CopG family [bacterium]